MEELKPGQIVKTAQLSSSFRQNMSQKKGKIYLVWNYKNWGGAQIYLLAVMKLAKADWDIEVWLPKGSSAEFIGYLDQLEIAHVLLENAIRTDVVVGFAGKLKRQFSRLISEFEIFRKSFAINKSNSVIHLETAPWQSWFLLFLLNLFGRKVFVTIHNFPPPTSRIRTLIWKLRLRVVSQFSNLHIFTSNKDTKTKFKGWFSDKFWHKIDVTYTCVDPDEISAAEKSKYKDFDKKILRNSDDFVVLSVGQFVDRKGRWVLLNAGKEVCEFRDDVSFLWLMPELPSEDEMTQIEEYGLGDKFKPILSSSLGKERLDILRFILEADIFVLPSYVEGLPIALLEAMASGIPCVATNINAIPEALEHEKSGLLTEPGDHKALAKAIIRLIDDPDLRERLSAVGRSSVLTNFDERKASAIVTSRYHAALVGHE